MHPGQMFLDEILNISNTHLLGQWYHVNNLLSFFKKKCSENIVCSQGYFCLLDTFRHREDSDW